MRIRSHDLAVCSWSLDAPAMKDLVESTVRLGLSHIHLALGPLIFLDDKQKHFELGQLRSSGITITAGMIGFPGEDYSTLARIRLTGGFVPDEPWELRQRLTVESAKLARELGIKILTTHVGFIPPSDHELYPRLLKRVGDVAAALAELEIDLAMESGQEPASEMLQFINDLPVRTVGVNFDPANMILYGAGDPVASVRTLGRHIRHVHIKDAIASENPGLDWGQSTPVGSGQVDFVELLAALAEVGYTGPLAIEQESSRRGEENVRAAIEYLQSLG